MGINFGGIGTVLGGIGGAIIGGPTGAAAGAGIGGSLGSMFDKSPDEKNADLQREFARNSIQWRVMDAKDAGIHPLAALGASTSAASPSYVGDPIAQELGQNITRAVSATQTDDQKAANALAIQSAQLDVEGKAIDNQIRLHNLNQMKSGPSFPDQNGNFIPGQGNTPPNKSSITERNLERTKSLKGAPYSEPGAITDTGWAATATGGLTPVPSQDIKQRIEDMFVEELKWSMRNSLLPNFGKGPKPPKEALPRGATHWEFNKRRQEYVPAYPEKEIPFGGYLP